MGSNALVTYSSTIVDTTPDRAAAIAVLTLPAIATGAGINRVSLIGTVNLTTGADTTVVAAQWYRGTVAANVPVGTAMTLDIGGGIDTALSVVATDSAPVGTIVYNLAVSQIDASADATVTGASAIALGTG